MLLVLCILMSARAQVLDVSLEKGFNSSSESVLSVSQRGEEIMKNPRMEGIVLMSLNPIPPFEMVNSSYISTLFKDCPQKWYDYLHSNQRLITAMFSLDNWEACLEHPPLNDFFSEERQLAGLNLFRDRSYGHYHSLIAVNFMNFSHIRVSHEQNFYGHISYSLPILDLV